MTIQNIANSQMSTAMLRLSTGERINSAADDAAGLAISEKLGSQIDALYKNADNVSDSANLLNTAEGSLNSINDSLSRMRELSVQASNGTLAQSDREIIQNEINMIKEDISSVVKNTEFNTMKLLDGSFTNKNVAMNPNGTGTRMSIENTSLETLGIKDFDVTGDFDISKIDDAIKMVTGSRSKIGSATNAFEHATANINNRLLNQTNAQSQIKDADIAKEISEYKKNEILSAYSLQMQRLTMDARTAQGSALINHLL